MLISKIIMALGAIVVAYWTLSYLLFLCLPCIDKCLDWFQKPKNAPKFEELCKQVSHEKLIGQTATCNAPLRPSGYIVLNGKRLEAKSEGVFIEKEAVVEIIGSEMGHLIVREKKEVSQDQA